VFRDARLNPEEEGYSYSDELGRRQIETWSGRSSTKERGFKDRDLYTFCFRVADAKALATPTWKPT